MMHVVSSQSMEVTRVARPVHIAFVGAGAVGCFYASRLHYVSFPLSSWFVYF